MQSFIIPVLAATASSVALGMALTTWRRLTKGLDKGDITVTRKGGDKSVTLPRNYSPAAVEQLLELTA
ncbi:MAG: hypothetical protein ACRYFX_25305 [Janthinobacterium lividum]